MKEEVTKLVTISTAHTAQIAQHEGTFNTLNVTLQFIQKNIEDSKIAFKEGLADLTKKIEKYFNGSKS